MLLFLIFFCQDDQHTEYEIQLFNELRETQQLLAEKSEIIKKLEAEREKILAAVNAEDETVKLRAVYIFSQLGE